MQDSTNDNTDQDLQCAIALILTRCFDSQNTLSSYDFSYEILLNLGKKKIPQPTLFPALNYFLRLHFEMVKKVFFPQVKNTNKFVEELSNENKIHATFKYIF